MFVCIKLEEGRGANKIMNRSFLWIRPGNGAQHFCFLDSDIYLDLSVRKAGKCGLCSLEDGKDGEQLGSLCPAQSDLVFRKHVLVTMLLLDWRGGY